MRWRSLDIRTRRYLMTYAWLLVLLGLTVAGAVVRLGALNTVLSLAIASAKAILIAGYFMHLRDEVSLTRVFSAAGLAWLAILMTLSLGDYLSRDWLLLPGTWPSAIARP